MGNYFVSSSAFPIAVREELQSIEHTDPIMRYDFRCVVFVNFLLLRSFFRYSVSFVWNCSCCTHCFLPRYNNDDSQLLFVASMDPKKKRLGSIGGAHSFFFFFDSASVLMMSSIGLVRFLICVAAELKFWPPELNKNQIFFLLLPSVFRGEVREAKALIPARKVCRLRQ